MQLWLVVLLQVLSHVASLRERLLTELTLEGPDPHVHAQVVEEVPGPHELFLTAVVLASVDHDHLAITRVLSVLTAIGEALELVEVLDIGVRCLVLDDVSIGSQIKDLLNVLQIV